MVSKREKKVCSMFGIPPTFAHTVVLPRRTVVLPCFAGSPPRDRPGEGVARCTAAVAFAGEAALFAGEGWRRFPVASGIAGESGAAALGLAKTLDKRLLLLESSFVEGRIALAPSSAALTRLSQHPVHGTRA